jgi:hypothetical protein
MLTRATDTRPTGINSGLDGSFTGSLPLPHRVPTTSSMNLKEVLPFIDIIYPSNNWLTLHQGILRRDEQGTDSTGTLVVPLGAVEPGFDHVDRMNERPETAFYGI